MSVNELYNLIRTEECCLWIGAGFSLSAGYPSAVQLQALLFQDLNEEEKRDIPTSSSLADFCLDFETIKGRERLVLLLQEIFGALPIKNDDHILLAKVAHFKSIITTNYDHLIEDAYPFSEKVLIKGDTDVSDLTTNKVKIYKIHGDIEDGTSMVITKQDYSEQYNRNFKDPFWASIIHEISSKHVIFLGYGYEDENIWADFDHIHRKLIGKQKKRFMVGPSFTYIKRRRLENLKITPIAMTGHDFLSGLIPVLKKYLAADLRNKIVSPDIAIQFARNFDVDLKLSSTLAGIDVLGIAKATGITEHTVTLQINDPSAIENFQKFGESYDQLVLNINQEHLNKFSMTSAGFEIIDLDFLQNFSVMHIPSSQGICCIEFVNIDKEIAGVNYKLYNNIQGKLLLDIKYFDFELIIKAQINTNNIEINLQVTEPENGARVSTCIQFYEAFCLFVDGEKILIHKDENEPIEFHLTENRNQPTFSDRLMNFLLLQKIENYFKVKFKNVSTMELKKQDQRDLANLLSIVKNGAFVLEDATGVNFNDLSSKIDWKQVVTSGFPKDRWVIFLASKPMIITVFGVPINLGLFEVEMYDPNIAWLDASKTSILAKTQDNKFIFRFVKYRKSPFMETKTVVKGRL
jgi:hypothetical protein